MVPVPPPAPGPVRVKVTAAMRAEPPGEAAPSLMVILTVWADESVCDVGHTIDYIQCPATKLVQLQYRFLLLEVRKVAELLVEPGTFETIESPLSATVIVPELFFLSSRRRHTMCSRDWSSDVCSSDLKFECPWAGSSSVALMPPIGGS